jgi:hypothetical protein
MQDEQYNTTVETKSVQTVVQETKNKQIDLNAKYQRDIVWKEDQKAAFINSVFKNIIPTHIILNVDNETNNCTCVDGKQRITSLMEFRDNKFPFEWNDELVFYDKANPRMNARAMTTQERSRFDNRSIPIVKYMNLSYECQVDVFSRIQRGKKLTAGELVMSNFTNTDACDIYAKFMEDNAHLVAKHITKTARDRKGHVILLSNVLCVLTSEVNVLPNKTILGNFFQTYDAKPRNLQKMLDNHQSVLKTYFSEDLLNNPEVIAKKMNPNNFLCIFLCCKDSKYNVQSLTTNQLQLLRSIILKTLDDIKNKDIVAKKTPKSTTIDDICKIFRAHKNELEKKQQEMDEVDEIKVDKKKVTKKPKKAVL